MASVAEQVDFAHAELAPLDFEGAALSAEVSASELAAWDELAASAANLQSEMLNQPS